jgi:acyl-CoA hydrolase
MRSRYTHTPHGLSDAFVMHEQFVKSGTMHGKTA